MPVSNTRGVPYRGLITTLFVASGAAGLIYQVVWSRQLVLVFGNTSQAVTTIVTAFMVGLGIGGFVGGRWADRVGRPLRIYGLVEFAIAILAILMPLLFSAYADVYDSRYTTLVEHPTQLAVIRFLLALASVAPATFLMGMTLPLIIRQLTRSLHSAGADLSELYAANTLGAVLGTVISGFLLIELLGLSTTAAIAIALNVLAALGALWVDRRTGQLPPLADEHESTEVHRSTTFRWAVLLAAFTSGFIALALEVLWTRMLSEGTGSSIYVFVGILAIYLLGIASGSALFRRHATPRYQQPHVLGLCIAGIGVLALTTVVIGSQTQRGFAVTIIVLLPATVLMGFAFPLAGRLLMRSAHETGRSIGLLYGVNTAGSILGSFAAGFVLAPYVGTNRAILYLGATSLFVGAMLALSAHQRSQRRPVVAAVAACIALASIAASTADMSITRTATQNALRDAPYPTTHDEDELATVDTLGGPPERRKLLVNGVGMTHLTVDTKLMAYLPKALRPESERLLVIAFGMGGTYRAGLIAGMETDAVEISPTVPKKMGVFFPDAETYVHHADGEIINSDGRNYVRLADERYDVVVVDPAPPLESAGSVVLYTEEFIEQSKERLNPGGTMMLWLPYDAPLDDVKAHMRTFEGKFTHVTFVLGRAGLYMFGSDQPLDFDAKVLRAGLDRVEVLADLADTPDASGRATAEQWAEYVSSNIWLRDEQARAFLGDGPTITDDHPRSEYYLLRRTFFMDNPHDVGREDLRNATR